MPQQRTAPKTSKTSKTAPLIRSSVVLRGLATALTLSSLGGMTSFAATHVQNTAAPLQPSTSTAIVATGTATPAATARTSTTTRRSTTITGAATTTTSARTKTKSS